MKRNLCGYFQFQQMLNFFEFRAFLRYVHVLCKLIKSEIGKSIQIKHNTSKETLFMAKFFKSFLMNLRGKKTMSALISSIIKQKKDYFRDASSVGDMLRYNMKTIISDPNTARECADEVLFLYDIVKQRQQKDNNKLLKYLLKIRDTSTLKRAIFEIFKAGIDDICAHSTEDENTPPGIKSLTPSRASKRTYRSINVFIQAIIEAYPTYNLNTLLDQINVKDDVEYIDYVMQKNCSDLKNVLDSLGPDHIILNGACEE